MLIPSAWPILLTALLSSQAQYLVLDFPLRQESHFGASLQIGSSRGRILQISFTLILDHSQLSKERDAVGKAGYGLCGKLNFQAGKRGLVSLMSFDRGSAKMGT
ncbi:hypothetical protein SLEP1_g28639 [Rubroshorea leprosula]|uniref:Legume lectin domain-containing protein n=1 Tax=Rubroshorea leprosula TaxID=152421 RepID=A0AAV5K3N6_9ROSI|nr:hypothetical protein SLEP1_g28639 [Rubroshorea leprosula]